MICTMSRNARLFIITGDVLPPERFRRRDLEMNDVAGIQSGSKIALRSQHKIFAAVSSREMVDPIGVIRSKASLTTCDSIRKRRGQLSAEWFVDDARASFLPSRIQSGGLRLFRIV